MHHAENFNRIRRILYSTMHNPKKGYAAAIDYLEGYKKSLGYKGYKGLKTELNFYNKNQINLNLIVAADVADHTDFSGVIDKKPFRIDVTSNLNYKELKTYEPLQRISEARYKIILASEDGDIDEIIDINFPFCPVCQEGRLIDIGVLLPRTYFGPNIDEDLHKQKHIGACNNCNYHKEYQEISSVYLPTFAEDCGFYNYEISRYNSAVEEIGEHLDFDPHKYIKAHVENVLPYLEYNFDKKIMALGDFDVVSDEFQSIDIKWKKKIKMVKDYIKSEYFLRKADI